MFAAAIVWILHEESWVFAGPYTRIYAYLSSIIRQHFTNNKHECFSIVLPSECSSSIEYGYENNACCLFMKYMICSMRRNGYIHCTFIYIWYSITYKWNCSMSMYCISSRFTHVGIICLYTHNISLERHCISMLEICLHQNILLDYFVDDILQILYWYT
mgnify:CR=1 FL=1